MIKMFEQFINEEEIHRLCREYNIKKYSIESSFSLYLIKIFIKLFKKNTQLNYYS